MAKSRAKTSAPAASRRATSRSGSSTRRGGGDEIEVVEEAGGMDWETGVCLITALLLVVALLLVDYEMGQNLGGGVLFK